MGFDIEHIRHDFPILDQLVYGKQLVYLDNAATTQKPRVVIDRITEYYKKENSNIHRGMHFLSHKATDAYEQARRYIQTYLNAKESHEIIFTKGTTEAINLVASSFCKKHLNVGDEILISEMEHHSNIVPWQMCAQAAGATVKAIPVDDEGRLISSSLRGLISEKTKMIAVMHVSNVLGTVNPVKHIIEVAHEHDIPVLVDGAQAMSHLQADVQELDADFYCFSGHKVYGPMGIGVLYGKEKHLEKMEPYQGGGEMVDKVTIEKTTYNQLPFKFEAGSPNVVGAIGLESALRYISDIELKLIQEHESKLLDYATVELLKIDRLRLIGMAESKVSVASFVIDGIHPFDAGTLIDKMGIAVRTGHHCAQPLMNRYGIAGTIRASFGLYNTIPEIDALIQGLQQAVRMLR